MMASRWGLSTRRHCCAASKGSPAMVDHSLDSAAAPATEERGFDMTAALIGPLTAAARGLWVLFSISAFFASIMPAPVRSRRSLTLAAVISAMGMILQCIGPALLSRGQGPGRCTRRSPALKM